MAFLKRLGYYMIGLTIGIIFLAFFLKKKTSETGTEFCYFPNCRVLKELRSKPLSFSDELQVLLDGGRLDSTDLKGFLTSGDVKFRKSDARATPCPWYTIVQEVDGREASVKAVNCNTGVTLSNFQFTGD